MKSDQAILDNQELWWKALKNLRAGMMPPAKKPRPSAEEQQEITSWIKSAVFRADPQNPDPGRITLRRLNRVEYRNTIRDLMGVEYDTQSEFPPDDTPASGSTPSPERLDDLPDAVREIHERGGKNRGQSRAR